MDIDLIDKTGNIAAMDSILIGLYLAGMVVVGIFHALRIRTAAEYLAAERTVGFLRTVGTVVATFCGAAAFIGLVGQGYASGINGIFLWIQDIGTVMKKCISIGV